MKLLNNAQSVNADARMRERLLASAALVVGLAVTSGVQAQTAAGAGAVTNVDEIYVTARKREERLIDVPVAITALSSEAVNRYGIKDMKALTENIPSLNITPVGSGGGSSIAIRGLGSLGADVGVPAEVSFVMDGVAVNRGRVVFLGMLDVEGVEVLKGPQALYFGKNSPAGVVSVTSTGPGETFGGNIKAAYEFRARNRSLDGAVNIPLAEGLNMRIAAKVDKQRGYVRNLAAPLVDPFGYAPLIDPGAVHDYQDGSRSETGRITLDYKPNERFSAVGKFLYAHYRANSEISTNEAICGQGVTQITTNNGFGGPNILDPNADCKLNLKTSEGGLNPILAAKFPLSNGGVPFSGGFNRLSTLNLNYDFDDVTLTSVTGLFEMKQGMFGNFSYAAPAFYQGGLREKFRQWSQEIRAVTTFDGPINFMVGGYYEYSRDRYNVSNYFVPLGPDPRNGQINSIEGEDVTFDETYSAFGSFDWKLAETVTLTAGARWTTEKKRASLVNTYVNASIKAVLGFDVFQPENMPIFANTKGDNISPEVTLSWHPKPDINIYGAFKTGYKSGGTANPGALQPNTAASLSFKPEKSIGGEVGAKGEWLDGTLRADVVIYSYKFKNLQVNSLDSTASPPAFRTTNAAVATTKGVEAQFTYRVVEDLSLRGNINYNRARYVDFTNAQCTTDQLLGLRGGCINGVQDFSGTVLPRAPLWTAGLGFTYNREFGSGLLLTVNGDANYKGKYFAGDSKMPETLENGYVRLDAGIKISDPEKGWEVSLSARNLTDHLALAGAYDKGGSVGGVYVGPVTAPRTVTLAVGYMF